VFSINAHFRHYPRFSSLVLAKFEYNASGHSDVVLMRGGTVLREKVINLHRPDGKTVSHFYVHTSTKRHRKSRVSDV